MNPELIRLIESNEIQIHGDVEYFAELVAAAEREECAKIAEKMLRFYTQGVTGVAEAIRARGEE